ncbi:MAG: hypothetical protein QXN63_01975 [Candidatus Bathyarchaeia archaeon]
MMPEKKRRRDIWDIDFEEEEEEFPWEREPIGVGSGYSMSITYDDDGKPTVHVKTYGNVNKAQLRKEIEQRYPEAHIVGLETEPLIRIVNEKEKEKEKSQQQKKKIESAKEKKSLIREIE